MQSATGAKGEQKVNRKAVQMKALSPEMRDLQYLRKGVGLTLAKVIARSSLLNLCGASNAVEAHERVIEAAIEMGDSQPARALRNALGINYTGAATMLGDRRSEFALENQISSDTVENWENEAFDELYVRLTTGNPALLAGIMRMPVFFRSVDIICHIYSDHREFIHRRDIVALEDNVIGIRYGSSEQSDLSAIGGVTIADTARHPDGVLFDLDFDEPLRRSESCEIVFKELLNGSMDQERVKIIAQSFAIPAARFGLEITFHIPIPRSIWWFEQMHQLEKPGKLTATNRMSAGSSGRVFKEFRRLFAAFESGIAWQ